jgi:hypothetical protein
LFSRKNYTSHIQTTLTKSTVECDVIKYFRATPPVLNMWPSKRKLDEVKSKHAGWVQQNGFSPAFFHRMLRLVKGTAEPYTYC